MFQARFSAAVAGGEAASVRAEHTDEHQIAWAKLRQEAAHDRTVLRTDGQQLHQRPPSGGIRNVHRMVCAAFDQARTLRRIDTSFNINVHTDSNGSIMGGSGGHSDAAAGSKLALIAAPLFRGRLPIVRDRVTCISTPGQDVDVLVTQAGVAVNPKNTELRERLRAAGLPVVDIHELKERAERITGVPAPLPVSDRVVAKVISRDGELLDTIRQVGR